LQTRLEEGSNISEKQLGRKIGKHAADFGLDPANPAHRAQLRSLIDEIRTSPDRVVEGTFRGQGAVKFLIKGEDVVVTTPAEDFVTILKGGIHNPAVRRALEL
jgi:Colicin D